MLNHARPKNHLFEFCERTASSRKAHFPKCDERFELNDVSADEAQKSGDVTFIAVPNDLVTKVQELIARRAKPLTNSGFFSWCKECRRCECVVLCLFVIVAMGVTVSAVEPTRRMMLIAAAVGQGRDVFHSGL